MTLPLANDTRTTPEGTPHARQPWRRVLPLLRAWLGIELLPVTHAERLASAAGGLVGMLLVWLASALLLGDRQPALLVVGSMGASAVLLFAVPHGALSQPWSVFGGHLVSAVVGVACARAVPHPFVAAALAIGLAIGAMHYLRCIHPPGGGTVLAAVLGGPAVHRLAFGYVIAPVLLNVVILLAAAVAVNALFAWRRYPAALARRRAKMTEKMTQASAPERPPGEDRLSHGDLEYALRQVNSMVDVTEEDLARIYQLAANHARSSRLGPERVGAHRYYCNGRHGDDWSVRQVLEESPSVLPDEDVVKFKVVAGRGRRRTAIVSRDEFARWARYEVVPVDTSWRRREDRP